MATARGATIIAGPQLHRYDREDGGDVVTLCAMRSSSWRPALGDPQAPELPACVVCAGVSLPKPTD